MERAHEAGEHGVTAVAHGPGHLPLAVVVADRDGRVSHWSRQARTLFGVARAEALGARAEDLMPVSGAFGSAAYTVAGRARTAEPGSGAGDVLWWAYPLVGAGRERLLVLAADTDRVRSGADDRGPGCVAPAFALRTGSADCGELARRLPEILPGICSRDSTRIASQVREFGYPALEFSRHERFLVTPDWCAPRRAAHRTRA